MKYFLALVFLVLSTSCMIKNKSEKSVSAKSPAKIINGRSVLSQDEVAKHIVGIYKKNETVCTGVIVAKNAVLTAAHCVDEVRRNGKISFGFDLKHLQFRKITGFIQHKDYDDGPIGISDHAANDVMVVRFDGDLPEGYEPAFISAQDFIQNSSVVTIAGYGRDENDEYDILKATDVKVVEAVAFEFRTDEKKTGSCDGDSGGPVFMKISDNNIEKNILVGSVSRGDPGCHQYGVYENMTYYKNWIEEKIKNLEAGLRE